MDKSKKRERNANFSREETEKLVSLIVKNKNVIENKKSDLVTWQEKEKVWKIIETEFNSCGAGVFRDAKHLKIKYEGLKRDARKKWSVIRAKRYKTADGVNEAFPLTPVEQKISKMISLSVDEGESITDSDQLEFKKEYVVTTEATIQPDNSEGQMTDTETDDSSNDSLPEIPPPQNPTVKRHILEPVPESSKEVNPDIPITSSPKNAFSTFNKPRKKLPFTKLAIKKLQTAVLQHKIIEEELQEKLLKKQILKNEMAHKNEMYKLEIEKMLLQIEILKTDLKKRS